MMPAHLTNQIEERLDHIQKHLTMAREKLSTVRDGEGPTTRMEAVLHLTDEFEVIRSDVDRALLEIGNKDFNKKVYETFKE